MRSLSDAQWDRFAAIVEGLNALPGPDRGRELQSLDGQEDADVLALVRVHFRLPREEVWTAGAEALLGYVLECPLGRGGFGEVWKARKKSGFEVALKAISRRDVQALGLELRAIGFMKHVRHPHLLTLIDLHETRAHVILESELASGTLADRLERVKADGLAGIPAEELLAYMDDAAEAIDFLNLEDHALPDGQRGRIQHRDVKPANLLLQGGRVKIGDFGIAKAVRATSTRHTGALTPDYASPEAMVGRVEPESDQYSLAATYVVLRTGALTVPPDLTRLSPGEATPLARALSVSPKDRYPRCKDLVTDLRQALEQANTPTVHVPGGTAGAEEVVPEGLRDGLQSFSAFVTDRTRGFLGREHVFSELDRFLAEEPSGYFVVRGHPGMGKSAIAARLVETRGYVHHFNIASQSISTPAQFLRNVCTRLILRYGLPHVALPADAHENPQFFNTLLDEARRKFPAKEPLVLVVDALDEVEHTPPTSNVLLLPGSLRDGVYVIVTTRPLDAHDPRRLVVSRSRYLELSGSTDWNRQDVVRYIESHLPAAGIRSWAEERGLTAGAFTEILAGKSEGNFMYLHYVVPAIARGEMQRFGIDELPQGLIDYYRRHWAMMRGADPHLFDDVLRPVVCVLAAVHQGVSAKFVSDTTGVKPAQVERALRQWREFLFEERSESRVRLYRAYHQSFREYLQDEVDPGLETYHAMIGDSALAELGIL